MGIKSGAIPAREDGQPSKGDALKSYFQTRVGRKMSFDVEAGNAGPIAKRGYEITVRGLKADVVMFTVEWADYDREGRKSFGGSSEQKVAHVSMKGKSDPTAMLETAAREADPSFFLTRPPMRSSDPGADSGELEKGIMDLMVPENRGKGEIAPLPGSVARLRAFHGSVPNLVAPQIFSSTDGTIRARWNHGPDKTLWINFPEKGALGWSVSIPRVGGYGMRKMNARCADEQDILAFASMMGISCVR